MIVVERHRSPGGLPDLIVGRDGGDWVVGFEGHAWHTHGDILHAWGYARGPAEAVRGFMDDVVSSRRAIVVYRVGDQISSLDVPVEWEVDYRKLEEGVRKYGAVGEKVEVCYWNGGRESKSK